MLRSSWRPKWCDGSLMLAFASLVNVTPDHRPSWSSIYSHGCIQFMVNKRIIVKKSSQLVKEQVLNILEATHFRALFMFGWAPILMGQSWKWCNFSYRSIFNGPRTLERSIIMKRVIHEDLRWQVFSRNIAGKCSLGLFRHIVEGGCADEALFLRGVPFQHQKRNVRRTCFLWCSYAAPECELSTSLFHT